MLNIKTLDSKITDRSFYKKICSDFDTRCLSSTNQTFEMHVKTRNNELINQRFLGLLVFLCSQRLLIYLAFESVDFENLKKIIPETHVEACREAWNNHHQVCSISKH
jgi:hypothetical protein